MELPLYAQGQPPQGKGLAETMSHFMPMNYRELSELSFFLLVLFFFSLPSTSFGSLDHVSKHKTNVL